ncbi:porin [Paraburkholderia sp. 2C]|jgi:predicted porin
MMRLSSRRYAVTKNAAPLICVTAALAGLSCAHAQSSVSIGGIIDGGVTYVNNERGGATALFDSGILTPDMLTFKATEDLGGGNKAIFQLTSQFDLGSGALIPGAGQIFGRTAFVGLSNERWGTLTLGNQYDFMSDVLMAGHYDGAPLFGGLYDYRQGPFAALGIPGNPTGSFDFDRLAGATRVPSAIKYLSPQISGLTVGALYGLGGTPGSIAQNSTTSFGANYEDGPFAVGAAYVEVKYPQLDNGNRGIRNFGFGMHYAFRRVLAMLLYTNTKNTASGAQIDVYKSGFLWQVSGPWAWGVDYQYMKGNHVLEGNEAQQVTSALQYNFSKRTVVYLEASYQRAGGNGAQAWLNGLGQPASGRSQTITRVGMQTSF